MPAGPLVDEPNRPIRASATTGSRRGGTRRHEAEDHADEAGGCELELIADSAIRLVREEVSGEDALPLDIAREIVGRYGGTIAIANVAGGASC